MNEHGDDNPFERFASSTTKGGGEIFYRELWEIILSFPVRETRVTKERRFLYPFLGYRSWTGLFFPILLEGVDLC